MPVALVTGSGRGIGKAIAINLAKNGYDVVVCGRDAKELKGAREEVESAGAETLLVKMDITKDADIKKLIKETLKRFKTIDLLVNNAGVLDVGEFAREDVRKMDWMIDVNLRGTIHVTREVLPVMLKQKKGVVINIASIVGKSPEPMISVYSATKSAVIGFGQALAQEVENGGVKVYTICPKRTQTNMYRRFAGVRAEHDPEDVAIEIELLLKNMGKVTVGSAITVSKHVR